jgi:hypothetical protein
MTYLPSVGAAAKAAAALVFQATLVRQGMAAIPEQACSHIIGEEFEAPTRRLPHAYCSESVNVLWSNRR